MTAFAGLVSRVMRYLFDALLVTAGADWRLRLREHEVVRLVTLAAGNARVEVVLRRRLLVAAAAIFGLIDVWASGVRIVAADARAGNARLGWLGCTSWWQF